MNGVAVFLSVLVIIALFSFMALSVNREYNDFKKSSKDFELKTFTSAVCEEKGGFVHCRDELFVNCNGKISNSSEIEECNGFIIENQVTGSAVFRNGWEDPRKSV